jgi:regulator of sirC expression with transglutaminase-like and TPR domain
MLGAVIMNNRNTLPTWSSLASLSDTQLRLFETTLLIAQDEYPDLDAKHYLALVKDYAKRLKRSLSEDLDMPSKLMAINHFLYKELGFSGNELEYGDPRNSYLNQVFERKLGIPISLAVVQIEVMQRIGLPLEGISFPGHYLVRLPIDDGIVVLDPFNQGRPVSIEELRERITPHMDGQSLTDQQLFQVLEPASARTTAMRMIRNLQAIYQNIEDYERVARCADRLLKLAPDLPEALKDRGLAYVQLGYHQGARDDFSRYLQLRPQAHDAEEIRTHLITHSLIQTALH